MENSRVIERFLEYVKIDSPTKEEKQFRQRLEQDLDKLGISHELDNAGDVIGCNTGNLIAKIQGTGDKTILFSAHMDTVSPGRGIEPEIKDGVITSKGQTILAADDKAGVSAIIEMLTVLKEEKIPHHNIVVAFTVSEEVGLSGSKNLDYSKFSADYGIVVDSGGAPGNVVVQGPAQNKVNVTFVGKAAHAGVAPEKGVSAIKIAAEAIANMKLGRIDEETTANIGSINGGGATNIVTDRVEIKAEVRSLNGEKLKAQTEHMIKCVTDAQEKYGLKAEIEVISAYSAFKIDEDSEVIKAVKAACEKAGLEFVAGKTGGGSDTNNYCLNNIPSVNLGIGMGNSHAIEEFINIEDIEKCTKLLIEIAKA
ncbi:M20/M25/M40 family metallo-hydrolase [Criibacterium bergeronii]